MAVENRSIALCETARGLGCFSERFFAQLKLAMERVADLSPLDAMDILEEAGADLPAALIFKDEALRRFNDLAKIESDAVRYAGQLRAERFRLKVGLPCKYEPPVDLIPGHVLDSYARDLPGLSRQLDTKPLKGREDQWLDDRIR